MTNKSFSKLPILLKTFQKASGSINIIQNSKDSKQRSKAQGALIGKLVLYGVLVIYCSLMATGFCFFGFGDRLPATSILISALIGFFFTLLKANGYLFAFKQYDLIMSLPVSTDTVIAGKFLQMYLDTLPLHLSISLPILTAYAISSKAGILSVILWLVLSLLLPLIPMTLATLLSAFIVWLSSGFKHKNILSSILIICISLVFIIMSFLMNSSGEEEVEALVKGLSNSFDSVSIYYPPAIWFSKGVTGEPLYALLFAGVSIVLFGVFVLITRIFYKPVNSRLMTSTTKRNYKMTRQNSKSPEWTIAYKELKRMLSSSTYLANVGLGEIMPFLLGVAAIFVDADTIVSKMLKGAPVPKEMILPVIPLIVYFLIGMVPSTVCSPSLEGKNAWILQSMPISKKSIYNGKLLFNLCLTIPFAVFATTALSISFNAGIAYTLSSILCIIVLCFFSSIFGLRCGIKYQKLEWENEIEVIKQGKAVVIYLFPNMFTTMIIIGIIVFLSMIIEGWILLLILTTIIGILSWLIYRGIQKL